jgi:uncharacterized membrane protein
LYAVLVLALAGISFQVVQVRIADALIPLSMVFGWPVVAGVTLGGAIANVASPMPSVLTDVTFGSIANLIASMMAWRIGKLKFGSKTLSQFLACTAATVTVTFIVGTYLAMLTMTELWIWWLGIGVGSVISINVLGFLLVQTLQRSLLESSIT